MLKFVKGSIEAKNYMAEMRAKRGLKPKVDKTDSKEHIKRVVNEALENYFISGTPVIEVPNKVVQVDKSGNAKLITTLTKAGNLKKVNGENVIKLESGDDLVIKTTGKKYNDVVNIPTHTIVHKSEPKKIRKSMKMYTQLTHTITLKIIDLPLAILALLKLRAQMYRNSFENIHVSAAPAQKARASKTHTSEVENSKVSTYLWQY